MALDSNEANKKFFPIEGGLEPSTVERLSTFLRMSSPGCIEKGIKFFKLHEASISLKFINSFPKRIYVMVNTANESIYTKLNRFLVKFLTTSVLRRKCQESK